MGWLVWLLVAVGLAIGEIFTPGLFFLGPVALAAGAAAIAAGLSGGLAALIVFVVCSVLSLAFLRPIARAHLHVPVLARTGTAALVGRRAVVLRRIDADGGGRVRIGGEEWSARPFVEGAVIEAGTPVDVVEIQGATALVME
jgi:membrane protein implicated in regulation of membrane protease activity